MASYSARILALYFAENCRRPGDRSGTSGSGGVVPVIAPESWRAATLRSIFVVMGEVPSPPSQLIDSSTRTVSLEVDTEGGEFLVGELATRRGVLGPLVVGGAGNLEQPARHDDVAVPSLLRLGKRVHAH